MSMDRKGFFKTLFGGFVAASTIPSLVKAEDTNQSLSSTTLTINPNGNLGIGETISYHGDGRIGLGTSTPNHPLHVSSIIFHCNNRKLQMGEDENGDFKIQWLDVKENETSCSIRMEKPKDDPWKTNLSQIR